MKGSSRSIWRGSPISRSATLQVRPSSREVLGAGEREVLEPRVMQVLVVLARRRGQVVSRDQLIEACWAGRVVGEDAINRCIGRGAPAGEAHGGFTVETIARVGYRLTEQSSDEPTMAASVAPARRPGAIPLDGRRSPSSPLSSRERLTSASRRCALANERRKPSPDGDLSAGRQRPIRRRLRPGLAIEPRRKLRVRIPLSTSCGGRSSCR